MSPREAREKRAYGYVFQAPALYPWRTVASNIALPLEIMGVPKAERAERVARGLDLVNLTGFGNKFPWQLSGGMQQRASIARALSFDPDLLLMDEPFGALDEIVRDMLNEQLLRLWDKTGKTALFVTHSIPEAVFLSTRIVVMSPRPGRIHDVIDAIFRATARSTSARRRNSWKSPTACATACARGTPMMCEAAEIPSPACGEGGAQRRMRAGPSVHLTRSIYAQASHPADVSATFSRKREKLGERRAPGHEIPPPPRDRPRGHLRPLVRLRGLDERAAAARSLSPTTTIRPSPLPISSRDSLNMERPKLPAPHQIAGELYRLIIATAPDSKRSLVFHAGITLEETLIGFADRRRARHRPCGRSSCS